MSHFDVVGDELEGDVMGEGYEVVGYDADGTPIVGAPRRRLPVKRALALPARPAWRRQIAPGVPTPDEGLVPLALTGLSGSPAGTFTASLNQITFQGQLQKPFRPERLLVSTVRTGTSSVGRLLTQLYVGTDLQQGDVNGFDAELVGAAQAFGTRLTCAAAEPGVLIRAIVTLSNALTSTDTIFANFTFLGRIIR
jgi:hypothetical protein